MTKRFMVFWITAVLLLLCGMTAFAAPTPVITVNKASAVYGDTAWATVSVADNPGITGMRMTVHYDASALTLETVENGALMENAGLAVTPSEPLSDGCTFTWAGRMVQAIQDGELLRLGFTVKPGTPAGFYPVSVTVEDLYDRSHTVYTAKTVQGRVRVVLASGNGDVNGDGMVGVSDMVRLLQYLADENAVTLNKTAADVNGDGRVDERDVSPLVRFVFGRDYRVLYPPAVEPTASQGLDYVLAPGGTYYTVTGMGSCTDKNLVIPGVRNGIPVKVIAKSAFYGQFLQTLTLGEGVTDVESYAFMNCFSLSEIHLSSTLETLGIQAFWGSKITEIDLPEGLRSIEGSAFGNTRLQAVEIPKETVFLRGGAFESTPTLTTLTVASGNRVYYAEGNCVINRSSGRIVAGCSGSVMPQTPTVRGIDTYAFQSCPGMTELTLPDNITYVGFGAFTSCTNLKTVTLSPKTTNIGKFAFWGCSKMTSIFIPASVTSIGDSAFYWCDALTDIYYDGTKEQWEAVVIEENNDRLQAVTVHFGKTPFS